MSTRRPRTTFRGSDQQSGRPLVAGSRGARALAWRGHQSLGFTIAAVSAVAASLLVGPAQAQAPARSSAQATTSPNVVTILTDDMRRDDLRYMPKTRQLFADQGATFSHALSPHPLCCPARATLVTGRYAQNNGVTANEAPWGGYDALRNKDRLIFRWFRKAGYRTSYVGRFLNGYEDVGPRAQLVPGLVKNNTGVRRIYQASGMVVHHNGDPRRLRGHQPRATTRSVIGSIDRAGSQPFFAWAGYVAPHAMAGGQKYAPVPPRGYPIRRGHRRPPSLSLPSFNAARPTAWQLRSPEVVRAVHRQRVRALYAVDDAVARIVEALKRRGLYRDTIIVFASDNGMGLGAHRVMTKNVPYQDVVRVPLMMTGPGVPRGPVEQVTTLVDLPGTLARRSGVRPLLTQDGGDLFNQPEDRAVLIQAASPHKRWVWRGVYTPRYTYVRYTSGERELYDRRDDPYELRNLADEPLATELEALLRDLIGCAEQTCAATFTPTEGVTRPGVRGWGQVGDPARDVSKTRPAHAHRTNW